MEKRSLIFSINDKIGGLEKVLSTLKSHELNLSRIESRPSRGTDWDYDFFVDLEATNEKIETVMKDLSSKGYGVSDPAKTDASPAMRNMAWFPRKISDLDEFANKILAGGDELSSDHPGFTDSEYRERREVIATIAKKFKHGMEIPRIEYTQKEIETWREVYNNLTKLFTEHACRQFNYVFPLLVENCGYGPDNIPQLEDISRFLQECTGFRLRPVQGLLSSRDFLNGLAFRVFHSTQYIRHASVPLYTPEPDVCHELLGHVPLFADPDFADFSQEIGLASLGASDEDILKLATVYWFTVEFGLCREDGQVKAFGAGLLSSFGELKYSMGLDEKKPEILNFDPSDAAVREYPITEYQPVYYCADSFQSAKDKISQFAQELDRPFNVRYNPFTQSVEILDSKAKLSKVLKDVTNQLATLNGAIMKFPGLN